MNSSTLSVAVGGHYPLDQAALTAFVETLLGLRVVNLDAEPPPRVLVWDVGSIATDDPIDLPHPTSHIPVLLLLDRVGSLDQLPVADGLFSKNDEAPETLGVAIRQVARGEQYLSLPLALALFERHQVETSPSTADLSSLSEREREVLTLLAQGLSNKDIASRLYLSVRTIDGHLARLYTDLGVHSRTEAALIAIQHHLVSIG